MKSYIKAIIIFNKNGEKRVVPLEQGVNIITGESKTGKSALVEIIDYCLCSTRCTIPKGKITDFSYLYTLVMAIDDNTYVIARYNWDDGSKMHFSILMTMVMPRTNISKEITATVKSAYGKKIKVFDTEIPHSIRAVEATAEGKSIFAYDKSGKVAAAYEQLGKEVAEIGEKQRNQNRADRIR